ncbi:TIGR03364 family FAD-dependent oxidoreductase [Catellatospora citrea]|uniref:Putative FAD dependent oxidoreductase n=1 Tax=Catellatospora citrea TaxID=53366 RepID=A0A8J3KDC2_9ACTN|nr:TIGR03364 family FAD-dependent oxidoreductase [Catellatospora citrea]RKE05904.1 FAD dependent oxidoreductase TIGR03364 [Catellatospora citrea]GIF97567.1 putative FAD dependent oxidoreductase [Catellatospora citrea]
MRVIIVGGGILGLMHARSAVRRGHEVVHLEREAGTRGASVRNFGLVWVSGRATGPELDLALTARQLWEEIGRDVPGVGFRANGSLTVLRTPAELAVAQEVCARPDAAERGLRLLEPDEARRVNPAVRGELLAAVLCERDAAVESRQVPQALRDSLAATGRYRWLPGREVRELSGGPSVVDHLGVRHDADLVVQCTGAAHTGLSGAHLSAAPLRRVRLQMMQTAPLDEPLTTSLADGDSLRYYPAWQTPALAALPPQAPVAAAGKMQLLLVQRLDGSLTIGDTHEYAEPFAFDVDEQYYDYVRAVAEQLLGRALPPTVRRWAGVYSQATDDAIYHRAQAAPGVTIVTGPGGRGMTLSPAIAEETFA